MSFGGIPLLYYGDELGTLNDSAYLDDPDKSSDSRWVHRPNIDWDTAALRNTAGTVEFKIFTALKRMIAVRKEIEAFADFNNRELLETNNPHLFVFNRYVPGRPNEEVMVVANFSGKSQYLDLNEICMLNGLSYGKLTDLYSGQTPDQFNNTLVLPAFGFYWLSRRL